MALAISSATPSIATQTVGTTATVATGSFTPDIGALLLPLWSANSATGASPAAPSITDSLATHLAWLLNDWQSHADAPTVDGQAAAWWAFAPNAASMTVTVTNGAASPDRQAALALQVITGADTRGPIGAHGKAGSASAASIAQSYTATRNDSWGFLVVCDWDLKGPMSAGAGTTLIGSADIGTAITYGFFRRITPDGVAGATTTLNATLGATSTSVAWAWVEVLPDIPYPLGRRRNPYSPLWRPGKPWRRPKTSFAETATAPSGTAEAGTVTLGLTVSGTAVHVGQLSGSSALGLAGSGTAKKVVALGGTCALGLAGSGTAAKRTGQAGPAALGLAGASTDRKVAVERGTSAVGLTAAGTGSKRAPQTGLTTLGFTGTRTSGPPVRAVAGVGYLGLAASGAAAHVARVSGTAIIGVAGSGTQRHVAKPAGAATLGFATLGGAVKRAVSRGLAVLGLAPSGYATRGSGQVEPGDLAVTGDPLGVSVRGDPRGHTLTGDPLHTTATGDPSGQTVTGDRLPPTVT